MRRHVGDVTLPGQLQHNLQQSKRAQECGPAQAATVGLPRTVSFAYTQINPCAARFQVLFAACPHVWLNGNNACVPAKVLKGSDFDARRASRQYRADIGNLAGPHLDQHPA